jgi:DNA polymerase III alpha subunit (gram-positive type)
MIYVSVDCEASGPMAPIYNLLSIGATVLRAAGDHHVIGQSFYVELRPIFPGFDADAVRVCGLDVAKLERDGVHPREAMTRFSDWVAAESAGDTTPVFVGHNAVFDWAYVAYYYRHFGLDNPFGYKGIDTKSLAMGRLGIDWFQTSKENLQRVLDLPPQDPARIHRADYDAWYQALILKSLLDTPVGGRKTGSRPLDSTGPGR